MGGGGGRTGLQQFRGRKGQIPLKDDLSFDTAAVRNMVSACIMCDERSLKKSEDMDLKNDRSSNFLMQITSFVRTDKDHGFMITTVRHMQNIIIILRTVRVVSIRMLNRLLLWLGPTRRPRY